jgi:mRNA interferase RelE/StbE
LAWTIRIDDGFRRDLRKVGHVEADRITHYLAELATLEDPRQRGKALVGGMKGLWRYRVGDHRILARIDNGEMVVLVLTLGHRREVYR